MDAAAFNHDLKIVGMICVSAIKLNLIAVKRNKEIAKFPLNNSINNARFFYRNIGIRCRMQERR